MRGCGRLASFPYRGQAMSREDDRCAQERCGKSRGHRIHSAEGWKGEHGFVEPARAEVPMCRDITCRYYGQRHATPHEASESAEAPEGETAKEMPLLGDPKERDRYRAVFPTGGIPWSLLEPHREQAKKNHDQTLERLSERGGLGPDEMVAIIEDRRWRRMDEADALARLKDLCTPAAQPETGDEARVREIAERIVTTYPPTFDMVVRAVREAYAAGRRHVDG